MLLMLPEGTNTYLVGQTSPYILIDTGEGRGEYVRVLEEALNAGPPAAGRAEISDIILTHKHHDHTNGVPSVLELLHRRWETRRSTDTATYPAPRVHKMPLTTPQLSAILNPVPRHLFAEAPAGHILHDIHEGQYFAVASEGGDADASEMRLEVIHTPGHTDDSLCLFFPSDRALFTADTVLGQSSTVFEDLGRYMGSLRKLINFNSPPGEAKRKYDTLYPGHGPTVPHDHVGMYLRHRVDREYQVVQAIEQTPSGGDDAAWTTWTLVQNIYAKYPQELWEPAAQSVDQHLRKLESEGRVVRLGGEERHTKWKFVE